MKLKLSNILPVLITFHFSLSINASEDTRQYLESITDKTAPHYQPLNELIGRHLSAKDYWNLHWVLMNKSYLKKQMDRDPLGLKDIEWVDGPEAGTYNNFLINSVVHKMVTWLIYKKNEKKELLNNFIDRALNFLETRFGQNSSHKFSSKYPKLINRLSELFNAFDKRDSKKFTFMEIMKLAQEREIHSTERDMILLGQYLYHFVSKNDFVNSYFYVKPKDTANYIHSYITNPHQDIITSAWLSKNSWINLVEGKLDQFYSSKKHLDYLKLYQRFVIDNKSFFPSISNQLKFADILEKIGNFKLAISVFEMVWSSVEARINSNFRYELLNKIASLYLKNGQLNFWDKVTKITASEFSYRWGMQRLVNAYHDFPNQREKIEKLNPQTSHHQPIIRRKYQQLDRPILVILKTKSYKEIRKLYMEKFQHSMDFLLEEQSVLMNILEKNTTSHNTKFEHYLLVLNLHKQNQLQSSSRDEESKEQININLEKIDKLQNLLFQPIDENFLQQVKENEIMMEEVKTVSDCLKEQKYQLTSTTNKSSVKRSKTNRGSKNKRRGSKQ